MFVGPIKTFMASDFGLYRCTEKFLKIKNGVNSCCKGGHRQKTWTSLSSSFGWSCSVLYCQSGFEQFEGSAGDNTAIRLRKCTLLKVLLWPLSLILDPKV